MQTEELIAERGKTHGRYKDHAYCTQQLKIVLRHNLAQREARNQPRLTNGQLESLEMILHKIGRIVAGDPNFQDHWDDLAGYAKIANDK